MKLMGKYNLLIFDWDGTVADSVHHIVTAMEAVIASSELPARSRTEILGIIGLGMQEAVATLYPDIDIALRQQMVQSYGQNYLALSTGKTLLFPKAKETLELLRDAGFLLAVATGKSRRGLERVFVETEIKHYFHTSRCADETFSKPHPQMLIEIMQSLDMKPAETLMIGDSQHDLQMAANANVASIAVSYGAQPLQYLQQFNPLTHLNCLSKLPAWLSSQ